MKANPKGKSGPKALNNDQYRENKQKRLKKYMEKQAEALEKQDMKAEKRCRQAQSSIKMRDKERNIQSAFFGNVATLLSFFKDKDSASRALANFDNDEITDE